VARQKKTQLTASAETSDKGSIPFHYIKSNFFRVVRADGAFGGITPQAAIHVSLFSERRPIPQVVYYEITREGGLGGEITERREAREGMVREVEVDAVMEEGVAVAIHKWLGEKIEELRKVKEAMRQHDGKAKGGDQ
jgi:hypothetical protein